MADLQRASILKLSQWSYNTNITAGNDPADNPIEIDVLELRNTVEEFVNQGPYTCDTLTADQHNDHHLHVPAHYTQSYCHIVIETHFDPDQSGGVFLTEKTFKPIKHGQMFFVAGPAGSLQTLRDLGYRTFDGILDTSYDYDSNNTHRWIKLRNAIVKAQADLPGLFERARSDIEHNQRLFLETKTARLNILLGHINESY
jgi:hypothetical protein